MGNQLVLNSKEDNCTVEEYEINFKCARLSGIYFITLISKEGVYEVIATDENEEASHQIRTFHRFDDKRLGNGFTHQEVIEYLQGSSVIEDIASAFNVKGDYGLW